MFTGDNRWNFVDQVDLIYMACHGNIGTIWPRDGIATVITSPNASCGGGHHTANKSGDLEYAAFLSCQVVTIESETTWDWLVNRGWKSYADASGNIVKGYFDGVHVVVGYHSNHHNEDDSYMHEAHFFADQLDGGNSIWGAWQYANEKATDEEDGILFDSVDLGEISMLAITACKDESIFNKGNKDYVYGDPNYLFSWRKRHYTQ
jgi:hypothetical protein